MASLMPGRRHHLAAAGRQREPQHQHTAHTRAHTHTRTWHIDQTLSERAKKKNAHFKVCASCALSEQQQQFLMQCIKFNDRPLPPRNTPPPPPFARQLLQTHFNCAARSKRNAISVRLTSHQLQLHPNRSCIAIDTVSHIYIYT